MQHLPACIIICILLSVLKVTIEVTYNPPSDFTLPSPPYYRPATSVTLTCYANHATGTVSYQWSSTCSSCFASSSTAQSISDTILKSSSAGVHTCTATDSHGSTGKNTTAMKLIGKKTELQSFICKVPSSMLQGLESMLKIADTLPIHLLPIIPLLYEMAVIILKDMMCIAIQILHRTVWDILGFPMVIGTIVEVPTITTFQECLCLAFVYTTPHIIHHGEFSHVNYLIQKEIH